MTITLNSMASSICQKMCLRGRITMSRYDDFFIGIRCMTCKRELTEKEAKDTKADRFLKGMRICPDCPAIAKQDNANLS